MSVFGPNFLHETLYDKKLDEGAKQSMIAAYVIWNSRSPALETEFMQELKLLDAEREKLGKRVEFFETQAPLQRDVRDLNNAYYDTIDLGRVYNVLYDAMNKAGEQYLEAPRQHAIRATMDLIQHQSNAQNMLIESVELRNGVSRTSGKRPSHRPF